MTEEQKTEEQKTEEQKIEEQKIAPPRTRWRKPRTWERVVLIFLVLAFLLPMLIVAFHIPEPSGEQAFVFQILDTTFSLVMALFVPRFFIIRKFPRIIEVAWPIGVAAIVFFSNPPSLLKASECENGRCTDEREEGGYKIYEEEVSIDLTNRKEVSVVGRAARRRNASTTQRQVRIVIRDLESRINEVNFRHATSLYKIEAIEKPKGAEFIRIKDKSKELVNPFTEELINEIWKKDFLKDFFIHLIEGRGRMKSYYMTVPITDRKSQEIEYTLEYYNAFQGREFEWAGKEFSANTEKLKMHITFPEDKPFKSKSLKTYKQEDHNAPKIAIEDPNIETMVDNHILTWTIRDAKKGEIFLIKWNW